MLETILREFVMVKDSVPSWEDAIRIAAEPLEAANYITSNYINQMIHNVNEHGPYIVIMPNVALPHSHAKDGALKTGLSIMKLHEPIIFPEDKEVQLVVVLSANDSEVHMQLLSELVDIFIDEDKMEAIFRSKDEAMLLEAL